MTARHEWFPIHEDRTVAGAIGALLAGAPAVTDEAARFGLAREGGLAVIPELGIEAHIAASLPEVDADTHDRAPQSFLAGRPLSSARCPGFATQQ